MSTIVLITLFLLPHDDDKSDVNEIKSKYTVVSFYPAGLRELYRYFYIKVITKYTFM